MTHAKILKITVAMLAIKKKIFACNTSFIIRSVPIFTPAAERLLKMSGQPLRFQLRCFAP